MAPLNHKKNTFSQAFTVPLLKPGPPGNESQSDGRTETIDYNFLKSSQSNVWYKTMKSQLVRYVTRDYGVSSLLVLSRKKLLC